MEEWRREDGEVQEGEEERPDPATHALDSSQEEALGAETEPQPEAGQAPASQQSSVGTVSGSSSSPFHGFSTQSEAEDTAPEEEVAEEPRKVGDQAVEAGGGREMVGSEEVRAQMCADFGLLGQEASEDTEEEEGAAGEVPAGGENKEETEEMKEESEETSGVAAAAAESISKDDSDEVSFHSVGDVEESEETEASSPPEAEQEQEPKPEIEPKPKPEAEAEFTEPRLTEADRTKAKKTARALREQAVKEAMESLKESKEKVAEPMETEEKFLITVQLGEEEGGTAKEDLKEEKDVITDLSSPKKVHFSDDVLTAEEGLDEAPHGEGDEVAEEVAAPVEEPKEEEKSMEEPVEEVEESDEVEESVEAVEDSVEAMEESVEPVEESVEPQGGTPKGRAGQSSSSSSSDKLKGVSPPLRLKIKFGKDKSGAITHCKIKSKHSPSSDEREEAAKAQDPDAPFHGFSEVPPARAARDYTGWDLTEPFRIQPTVYVSISSKRAARPPAQAPRPAVEEPPPTEGRISPVTGPATPRLAAALRGELGRVTITPSGLQGSGGQAAGLAKQERKKPSFKEAQYVRPLWEGWLREVVWRTGPGGRREAEVSYSPAEAPGQPRQRFRSPTELEAFLITSGSCFPLSMFTFRKEPPVGGPEGSEVVREAADTMEEEPGLPELGLGKRVRKPPEKLVAEEPEAAVTPSRGSKRVSRPPGKYVDTPEEPPPKAARGEAGERRPSSSRDWAQQAIGGREARAVPPPAPAPVPPERAAPGLKLRTFSKMGADSRNQVSPRPEESRPGGEDVIMVEGEPETAPAPQIQVGGLAITKLVKPAVPGAMISLPGLPTTGPPPRAYAPVASRGLPPVAPHQPASLTPVVATARPPPQPRNLKPAPKILRPSRPTQLPCSIHCPGVTGIPSLSCTACHCLFHPKCVGLPAGLGASPLHKFYCNDCTPAGTAPGPAPALLMAPAPAPVREVVSAPVREVVSAPVREVVSAPVREAARRKSQEASRPPQPPVPFTGQMMVNIAGRKFLVTPHPAPAAALESPPPSPPLLPVRNSGPSAPSAPAEASRPRGEVAPALDARLHVLLRPADGAETPCFGVEQTGDGKFLLVPWGRGQGVWPGQAAERGRSAEQEARPAAVKSWGNNFTNNLSGGYHAMMQVFRYLSVRERLQASSVCRLWRDIALHHSLWQTVSLKNTRVYSWAGFGEFLRQTKATHLDVRKMLLVKERDVTWAEIVAIAPNFSGLKKLELPKVDGCVLAALASACPRLESLHAPLVAPPLDLGSTVRSLAGLQELRLKACAGAMLRVPSGVLEGLPRTLTHLSLLTLEGLAAQDYDVFGTLVHLQLLEIGDCTNAPYSLFKTLSDLTKLQRLRLERGSASENVGKLANAPALQQLEMVDFNIGLGFRAGLKVAKNIRKLLIIPTYQNEVAKINSEIIQGVTEEMRQLQAFYLGVTNEWLEAMALAMGTHRKQQQGGEKECFPLERNGQVEHISLPALYRLVCREMGPGCKVKVLKMSAQATCKQFIANLDQS